MLPLGHIHRPFISKNGVFIKYGWTDIDHLVVFLDISDIQDEKESYEIRDGKVVWLGGQVSKVKDFVFEYTGLLKNIWTLVVKIKKTVIPDHESLRTEQDKKYGMNRYRSLWTIRDEAYEDFGEMDSGRPSSLWTNCIA